MNDQSNNPTTTTGKALSDISHLFLSSIREKHANDYGVANMPRPKRMPPGAHAAGTPITSADVSPIVDPPAFRSDASIDLTPEEFAQVLGGIPLEYDNGQGDDDLDELNDEESQQKTSDENRMPPISAIIASHLNKQNDSVREYAAHLSKDGQRVGLIQLDASEFRLSLFEPGMTDGAGGGVVTEHLDGRQMAEMLEELNWDVDRWLLHLPVPRGNEPRALLRMIDRWTVLSTCDHDGVVSCYRSLKGLNDLHDARDPMSPPVLSLALLRAHDEVNAMRAFRKLSNVCQQFLHWPLESEAPVIAAGSTKETVVLSSRSTRDKGQLATAPQWDVVSDFLKRCRDGGPSPMHSASKRAAGTSGALRNIDMPSAALDPQSEECSVFNRSATAAAAPVAAPALQLTAHAFEEGISMNLSASSESMKMDNTAIMSEVIDLPAGAETSMAIVSATLRGNAELVECPVKPPMLMDASLAVTRDRRLVLLAVAKQGLCDLRAIGEAWRWLNENRTLIAMAVPQCSIDGHATPSLRLLIDRADLSAATLQPLLQSGNVTVQTYRKLRWGGKTGLLLEAA